MTEFTPRQKEALDVSRSVGVTASAGTGKTFLLQNRFVALLRNGAHPREILCLTFTDKAAAEMRDKIEQALRRESEAEIAKRMDGGMTREEAEENNLTRALASIHQCTISTFHGFCSGLLHEFPIEADIPISYSIMDSLAVHDLVTTTIADTLHQPGDGLRGPVTLLFRSFDENQLTQAIKKYLYAWPKTESWFAQLQEHPDEIAEQWNAWKKETVESAWSAVVNDVILQEYCAIALTTGTDPARRTAEIYARLQKAESFDEKLQMLAEFSQNQQPASKVYEGRNKYYTVVRNKIKDLLASGMELIPADDPRSERMVAVMQAFGTVTAAVHAVIHERKRDGGYLDFDDLIAHVEHLLDTNERIRRELCARYRYILVDEVQDNDPVLTKLVRILAEDLKMKNKLFVVGDMKQAIYEFRGADSAGFQELLDEFPQDPVELDVNYRTVPFLIDVINTVFSRIYAPGNPDNISYPQVSAKRETTVGSFTILHNPDKKSSPSEGERLAAWIHDRIENQDLEVCDTVKDADGNFSEVPRKATYRDIAILIRNKKSLDYLLPALKTCRIPFHVYKGNGFYEEQEIADLMNVIRASVFHENEPALYGALISPYFGISDEQLAVALTAETRDKDGKPYDPQKMKYSDRLWKRLSLSADVQITQALEQLKQFRKASRRLPASAFVRKIVQDTGILSVYGALDDGIDKIHNVRKFLDTAISLESGKGFGIMDFIQTIETCIAESINDEIGAAEANADTEDRVQIMTVHVSKGLEFKVVVLFRAGEYHTDTSSIALYNPKYQCCCRSLKMPVYSDKGLFDFLIGIIGKEVAPREEASERRLFYVGMTRPRDHLVLTYSGANPTAKSFMSYYRPVSSGIPAEIIEECAAYPPELAEESEDIRNRRAEILQTLPVGLKIAGEDEETVKPELYRYGSCVHELFEGREDKETILQRYGYGESDMAEFERIITAFRNHPFLKNVAKEWHELSFTNANGERRRADMVVRYEDGTYRIIDFKTDDFRTIPADRRTKYFDQLTEYSACLFRIFHTEQPIPACFYATRDGVFIDLDEILTYTPAP